MKEERSNIDQTCLDIEKIVEDSRSKEKEYKEGVLQQNLVILRSTLVLDSEDEFDKDYETSSEVPEQYRLSTERLRDIVQLVMMIMMMTIMKTLRAIQKVDIDLCTKITLWQLSRRLIRQVNVREE